MSKGIDKESIMQPRIRQLGQVAPPTLVIGAQSSGRDVNDVGVMMSPPRFSKTTKSSMLHTSKRPIDQSLSNYKGIPICHWILSRQILFVS